MKSFLRQLFSPILTPFESWEGEYRYRKSSRLILKVVGVLFLVLSTVSLLASLVVGSYAAIIPVGVFFCGGAFCLVIGGLGSDRAVAKVWGNK